MKGSISAGLPGAIVASTLLAAVSSAADAPKPSGPAAPITAQSGLQAEFDELLLREQTLQEQVRVSEKDGVEAAALNRARMGLAIVLAQRSILELRLAKPGAFDTASEHIRKAESYIVAVDTTSLSVDDRRVFSDLQALCRRALSEQVEYLRRRIDSIATPASASASVPVTTVPAAPVYYQPVYYYPTQTPVVYRRQHSKFHLFSAR